MKSLTEHEIFRIFTNQFAGQPSKRSCTRHIRSWVCGPQDSGSTRGSKTRGHSRRDRTLRESLCRLKDPQIETKEGSREISITRQSCTLARSQANARNRSSQEPWN